MLRSLTSAHSFLRQSSHFLSLIWTSIIGLSARQRADPFGFYSVVKSLVWIAAFVYCWHRCFHFSRQNLGYWLSWGTGKDHILFISHGNRSAGSPSSPTSSCSTHPRTTSGSASFNRSTGSCCSPRNWFFFKVTDQGEAPSLRRPCSRHSEDEGNDRTWRQHQRPAAAFAKVEAEAENSHLLLRLGGGGSFFHPLTSYPQFVIHLLCSSTHFCSSSSSISIFGQSIFFSSGW